MNYNQRDTLNTMVYREGMDALDAIMQLLPSVVVSAAVQRGNTDMHSVYAHKLKEAKKLLTDAYIIREAIKESQEASV